VVLVSAGVRLLRDFATRFLIVCRGRGRSGGGGGGGVLYLGCEGREGRGGMGDVRVGDVGVGRGGVEVGVVLVPAPHLALQRGA